MRSAINRLLLPRIIVTLAGYIKDAKSGEPVVGASVYFERTKIGVSTDQYGYYSISLPRGNNVMNIQSIGMRDARRQIALHSDGKLNVDMRGQVLTLKKVVISAQKLSNVKGTQMGLQKIDIKVIRQVPVVFGEADVLRVRRWSPRWSPVIFFHALLIDPCSTFASYAILLKLLMRAL